MKRIAALVSAILLGCTEAPSQIRPVEQLIENLTHEVRTLRLALEQWKAEDSRRLLLLERFKLQHQIAAAANDRLDSARSELREIGADVARLQEQLASAELNLRESSDIQQQPTLQSIARDAREALARARARQDRLDERERQLALDADESNRKLQSLDNALESTLKASK